MSTPWIPNYIRQNINYHPKDILTAQEYNAILNLLIAQGDYNSSWLEYLQNDAIPDAIADLSAEAIAEAISTAVQNEIAALTAAVATKTSRQLNNPAITILNIGAQYSGIAALKTLLDTKGLKATYAVPVNLVGQTAYPTVAQLTALKAVGNDIVSYGTDGSALTAFNAATVVAACKTFVTTNAFNDKVFIYPTGNSIADVQDVVAEEFKYAANILNDDRMNPVDYPFTAGEDAFLNLPIIKWDSSVDVQDIKDYVDSIVVNNFYMILQVNTDLSSYDPTDFETILDYIKSKSSMQYPANIQSQMNNIFDTVGNKLALLNGLYLTEQNGELYLNW